MLYGYTIIWLPAFAAAAKSSIPDSEPLFVQAFSVPVLGADSKPAALPAPVKEATKEAAPPLDAPSAVSEPAPVLAAPSEPAHVAEASPAESPAAEDAPAAVEKVCEQDAAMADAEVRALCIPCCLVPDLCPEYQACCQGFVVQSKATALRAMTWLLDALACFTVLSDSC